MHPIKQYEPTTGATNFRMKTLSTSYQFFTDYYNLFKCQAAVQTTDGDQYYNLSAGHINHQNYTPHTFQGKINSYQNTYNL